MSPWTKRLQRRTRSLASFSGLKVTFCALASGANSAEPVPTPATAAAPAELSRNLRRLKEVSLIEGSPVCVGRCRNRVRACVAAASRSSGGEARAVAGVEEVRPVEVGHEVDRAARREIVTLAKDRGQVGAAVAAGDEGVGAGRLHDDDARGDPAFARQAEVLGTRAEDDRLAIAAAGG